MAALAFEAEEFTPTAAIALDIAAHAATVVRNAAARPHRGSNAPAARRCMDERKIADRAGTVPGRSPGSVRCSGGGVEFVQQGVTLAVAQAAQPPRRRHL